MRETVRETVNIEPEEVVDWYAHALQEGCVFAGGVFDKWVVTTVVPRRHDQEVTLTSPQDDGNGEFGVSILRLPVNLKVPVYLLPEVNRKRADLRSEYEQLKDQIRTASSPSPFADLLLALCEDFEQLKDHLPFHQHRYYTGDSLSGHPHRTGPPLDPEA